MNDDENYSEKISIDDLYTRKNEVEENKLKVFRKILNRVHTKIKITSRQRKSEQFTFFVIPEFLVGIPRYDVAACTAYIIDKLKDNGFLIKYTHPNLLFISWAHYYDKTRRMNVKKEYGVNIDGFGNVVKSKNNIKSVKNNDSGNMNNLMFANKKKGNIKLDNNSKKNYKQISTYKPTGNLIYSNGLLKSLENSTK
jgi:hypothetical protein